MQLFRLEYRINKLDAKFGLGRDNADMLFEVQAGSITTSVCEPTNPLNMGAMKRKVWRNMTLNMYQQMEHLQRKEDSISLRKEKSILSIVSYQEVICSIFYVSQITQSDIAFSVILLTRFNKNHSKPNKNVQIGIGERIKK